jgi:hypothetical protein
MQPEKIEEVSTPTFPPKSTFVKALQPLKALESTALTLD